MISVISHMHTRIYINRHKLKLVSRRKPLGAVSVFTTGNYRCQLLLEPIPTCIFLYTHTYIITSYTLREPKAIPTDPHL